MLLVSNVNKDTDKVNMSIEQIKSVLNIPKDADCYKAYIEPKVAAALSVAYFNGVDMETLVHIRTILTSGMTVDKADKPIIGLRDTLMKTLGGGGAVEKQRYNLTTYAINSVVKGKRTATCHGDKPMYTLDLIF